MEDGPNDIKEFEFDFEFKDYAPFVFSNIRSYFGFDTAGYLVHWNVL